MESFNASARERRPAALSTVAQVFIVYGLLTAISTVSGLFHHRLEFNSGLLGLFVGPGLLRLSRGWRTTALVLLWLSMVSAPIFAFLALASPGPARVVFFDIPIGTAPQIASVAYIVVIFGVAVCSYRVLVRPDVRRAFGLAGAAGN